MPPIRWVMLALLLAAPATAQDRITIPDPGQYMINGTLSDPRFGRWSDTEEVYATVNRCGDKVTFFHAFLNGGSFTMLWNGEKYIGNGGFGGQGRVSGSLTAATRSRLTGDLIFRNTGAGTQYWEVTIDRSAAAAADLPLSGGVERFQLDTAEEIDPDTPVFRYILRNYRLRLSEFYAGSSDLQPLHGPALRKTLTPLSETEYPGLVCATPQHTRYYSIEGIADNGIERRRQQEIGTARALSVLFFLQGRSETYLMPHILAGRPGSGATDICPRAALIDYAKPVRHLELRYTRQDLKDWMNRRFDVLPETHPHEADGKWSRERLEIKGIFCMGYAVIQMTEDGLCEPPEMIGGSRNPAHRAMFGQSSGDGFAGGHIGDVEAAWKESNTIRPDSEFNVVTAPISNNRAVFEDTGGDPYADALTACPENVKAIADGIERDHFRDLYDDEDDQVTRWENFTSSGGWEIDSPLDRVIQDVVGD